MSVRHKEIYDNCFSPHLPVHFSPLIFSLLLWKLHYQAPRPDSTPFSPGSLYRGYNPALPTPPPNPKYLCPASAKLHLMLFAARSQLYSRQHPAQQALLLLPAVHVSLAPRNGCNRFEPHGNVACPDPQEKGELQPTQTHGRWKRPPVDLTLGTERGSKVLAKLAFSQQGPSAKEQKGRQLPAFSFGNMVRKPSPSCCLLLSALMAGKSQ